ncbi:iron-siderophore ABC transporter substrate-binding protein [Rhizobium rhizogenes]|uniref:iron-siderophore ABC transporter substrate-binding protein n=1 Tax=Rhizobium rhizogenes TaxID=359 RepID=UPI0015747AB8|nr:iron-siderophore ABC transporter substrate-binding protein [Rhizobium rhizogenes]NTF44360.1 iron-siderophore ABC transporter substrate-binding protein [Rhizobium rhizogenes]
MVIDDPARGGPLASHISRRQALALLAAFSFPGVARASTPRRVVAIDWAMLETLVALGVMPIAATELVQFRRDAIEPALDEKVADLGLRGSPNFELLRLLRPELILISPFYARYEAIYRSIAPVLSLPFYVRGEPPYQKALDAVTTLAAELGLGDRGHDVLVKQATLVEETARSLQAFAARPTYLVNVGDSRHVRVFGADSMFGDILVRLGLRNAWKDRSRYTFAAPVPIENLVAEPEARIVVISEIPVEARNSLKDSIIWQSLPPVRAGRVLMLDNINPYGGIVAAARFMRLLKQAMLASSGETL